MGKGFTRIIFLLFSLLFSCLYFHNIQSEASDLFFEVEIDKTAEVFIFDGFELSPIDRYTEFIKKKLPVTEGSYFILFFVKEGYVPIVKVLRVGQENIKLGKIEFEKMTEEGKGFLIGVVYKPVHGGKVLYRKGIVKLFEKAGVKIISDRDKPYLIQSGDDGVYKAALPIGEYKVYIGNQKVFDVLIEEGKTTIQNIQKGMVLID